MKLFPLAVAPPGRAWCGPAGSCGSQEGDQKLVELENRPLTVKEAKEITGGLSEPSKMPGRAYNLPAQSCRVGSILRKRAGSTCSRCYARKGRYVFADVQRALARRLRAINHPRWVEAMSFLINHYGQREPYFRWHDSGDLQSLEHLEKIIEVVKRTPNVRHWLPTREFGIIKRYLKKGGEIPDNLVIRLSAVMIDELPPDLGLQGSCVTSTGAVPEGVYLCPALSQGNVCGSCRACWDPSVKIVAYKLH